MKVFAGNQDSDTVVYHNLAQPIRTRYIRFRPVSWNNWISMRVELFGCQGKYAWNQEIIRGQRGTIRRWLNVRIVRIFLTGNSRSFIDKTNLRAVCHFIEFTQNIRSRLALMWTSRKTDSRSRDIPKITLVELTYPKAWTWSLPLCPLIFSWWKQSK